MISCATCEQALGQSVRSVEVTEHLSGCASCQLSDEVLRLATLPPLSELERSRLAEVTAAALRPGGPQAKGRLLPVATLAAAAAVGALVAWAWTGRTSPATPQAIAPAAAHEELWVAASDDETDFQDEVDWGLDDEVSAEAFEDDEEEGEMP